MASSGTGAAKPRSLVGTRVGRYTLERLLGRGAFGEVYVGAPAKGARVAVKLLEPSLARDEETLTRFEREAETAGKLEHPGIVRVLDVGSSRGRHYIVMELVHGGSFRKLLKKGGAPAQLLAILTDVARALAFAHAAGVVHRDVKPENVLLTRSKRAKVADFGLARAGDQTTLTTDGKMIGTAVYMSPEQARGERAGPPADVYAVGLMLYEVIAGEKPFSSETPLGFIYQHVEHEPPRPRLLEPYPPSLASLALRCLAKDPAQRPSMAEVAARLGEAQLVRPRRALRAAAIAVATAAALALLAVAAPSVLNPLCGDWFGAAPFRAARSAAQKSHDALTP